MAKPIRALELHFPMIQILIMAVFSVQVWVCHITDYDSTKICSDNRSPDSKECFIKLSKIRVSLHTVTLR